MPFFKDDKGIDCFSPDNSETELWLEAHYTTLSLDEILDRAKDHFGDKATLENLHISPEHIHTRCLYYDAHDPMDWTNYIKVELIP